jgi:DNA-binding IclR family transcriptional regulator
MAQDLVKSAARTFEVLEVFAAERARLTATRIGALLGYPKSSLNVLLRSMVTQGYLSLDTAGSTYFPTLRVTQLGDWIPLQLFGSDALLPALATLRDTTGETVTLTMAVAGEMRLLRAVQGTHPIALQLDDGTTFPMFGTAVGTAYLMTLAEPEIEAVVRGYSDDGDRIAAARAAIGKARSQGFAAAYETVVPDTGAIAIPLRLPDAHGALVLAVAGLDHRIKSMEADIVRSLRNASEALGAAWRG